MVPRMKDKTRYQAYLVRFQRGDGQQQWRVTLQNANTGEQMTFTSEGEAFRYLVQALSTPPAAGGGQPAASQR